ncbi:MAG: hypothetical protein HQ557_10210 [Bacteroidetes bacterium]|nr:hypothetical protein [Bacteroidota bacterium]
MNPREPLELSETFRHFNSLMWQIPSWGIAIATGVILAANEIGKAASPGWEIHTRYVQALVILFGVILLVPLTMLHHRFRAYEADSAPKGPLPKPPFDQAPHAERYMQLALCMTTAGLLALATIQIFPGHKILIVILAFLFGFIVWMILNKLHKSVVEEIKKARGEDQEKAEVKQCQKSPFQQRPKKH